MKLFVKAFAFVAATGAFIAAQAQSTTSYAQNSKTVEAYTDYSLAAYQDTTPKDTTKKEKKEKKKEKEDTSSTTIVIR